MVFGIIGEVRISTFLHQKWATKERKGILELISTKSQLILPLGVENHGDW
jgi:hypothetical protein